MIENQSSARWIAIVGVFVGLSACAACLLLTVLLSSAYGGQTIRFRNPFAAPQEQVADNTGNGGGSSSSGGETSSGGGTTSGGGSTTSGGSGSSNNNSGSSGTGGTTSGGTTSGGGSVAAGSDATNYLPRLSGYTQPDVSSISGALDFVIGAQSAEADTTFQAQSVSAIVTSVLVSRLDEFVACYQQTGAVDAQIYIRTDVGAMLQGEVPTMGAVVVANQDRLRESLVSCAVSPNDPNSFSAQAANEPCGNFGTFNAGGDAFTYVYAGTATEFCTAVESHFGGFGG